MNSTAETTRATLGLTDIGNGRKLLEAVQWFPFPPEKVFPFFADALNLNAITPPWLHFRILTAPPIEMKAGSLIDYHIRLYRVPIRWRTRIAAFTPCTGFVDEQIRGPYKLWHHEHIFRPDHGGTEMIDRVTYAVPLGSNFIGNSGHALFVRGNLRRIFAYRGAQLTAIFRAKPGVLPALSEENYSRASTSPG